jgi:hypothetical protein
MYYLPCKDRPHRKIRLMCPIRLTVQIAHGAIYTLAKLAEHSTLDERNWHRRNVELCKSGSNILLITLGQGNYRHRETLESWHTACTGKNLNLNIYRNNTAFHLANNFEYSCRFTCQTPIQMHACSVTWHISSFPFSLSNLHKIGACPEETTGEAVTQGIFFWNVTEGNNVVFRNCPYGYSNGENLEDSQSLPTGIASRSCQCNDNNCQRPYWGEPDISRCKYRVYNNSEITDALSILYQVWENSITCLSDSRSSKC